MPLCKQVLWLPCCSLSSISALRSDFLWLRALTTRIVLGWEGSRGRFDWLLIRKAFGHLRCMNWWRGLHDYSIFFTGRGEWLRKIICSPIIFQDLFFIGCHLWWEWVCFLKIYSIDIDISFILFIVFIYPQISTLFLIFFCCIFSASCVCRKNG